MSHCDTARPTLHGPHVTLRAPTLRDLADRLAAGRDPEFRRMVGGHGQRGPLTEVDAQRWFTALCAEPHGWVVEHQERCIGEARLHGFEPAGQFASLAVGLFAPENRGRGFGTETVQLLLEHAFGTLALGEVRLRVLAFNVAALACYRRCGFREIKRERVELGSEAAEDILMALTAAEFRATPLSTSVQNPRAIG